MSTVIDWTRPLTNKEAAAFRARQRRIGGAYGESAIKASDRFNTVYPVPGHLDSGLRIRPAFSCLSTPAVGLDASDRRAPRLSDRPPATRLMTSQGLALRLYLTIIAAAQASSKPGTRFRNELPINGAGHPLGWNDLVATGAERTGRGVTYSSVRDKKGRSIRTALNNLADSGLVDLVGERGRRGRHEDFVVLNDMGWQNPGDPIPYEVPRGRELVFTLPAGFVRNGWLHILEDSEIAVLLMIACGAFSLTPLTDNIDLGPGEVAIPGVARLERYGIHRDPYSTARKTLEWFGLLSVREIDRHNDGRAENASNQLHRLMLLDGGFEASAFEVVPGVLTSQLDRHASL